MCLIIDVNTIPKIFNKNERHYTSYQPVLDWITNGNGKIVYGGTKYKNELKKLGSYIRIINQLKRAGKVITVCDKEVDSKTNELSLLCSESDFDDPHIVALLVISGCQILCSEDKRSYTYIKRKEWYPKKAKIPKIYKSSTFRSAKKIIKDENIAEICKTC